MGRIFRSQIFYESNKSKISSVWKYNVRESLDQDGRVNSGHIGMLGENILWHNSPPLEDETLAKKSLEQLLSFEASGMPFTYKSPDTNRQRKGYVVGGWCFS